MTAHTKHIEEIIGLSEARTRKLGKRLSEEIVSHDKSKQPFFVQTFFDVSDDLVKGTGFARSHVEIPFTVSSSLLRRAGKNLVESFEISEELTKTFVKNITETIVVADTLLRNANAILFDLVLRDDVLDLTELAEISDSPPVGYTPFKVFYPGDYQGQKFMVGTRIKSADTTGRAGILGLQLNVDVVDVTDRGSAEIEVGEEETGVYVPFEKTFTVPPDVYPVWAEGSSAAVPEILEVTTAGFTFILRDINTPSVKVTGSITWAAIGR